MKLYAILPVLLLVVACGGENVTGGVGGEPILLSGPVLYPDDGTSNRLFTCEDAAIKILDSVELGMSKAQVRSLVGKPRHISSDGEDWRYGSNDDLGSGSGPSSFSASFYFLPATNFKARDIDLAISGDGESAIADVFLDDFSGDYTKCLLQKVDDTPFIEAANSYAQTAGTIDFTDDVTMCYDAAIRIAASVEQGMSLADVRKLVGKPVEFAQEATFWRYSFGKTNVPFVFFTEYNRTGAYFVTGYSSIVEGCGP